jgi:hypothetical protein
MHNALDNLNECCMFFVLFPLFIGNTPFFTKQAWRRVDAKRNSMGRNMGLLNDNATSC